MNSGAIKKKKARRPKIVWSKGFRIEILWIIQAPRVALRLTWSARHTHEELLKKAINKWIHTRALLIAIAITKSSTFQNAHTLTSMSTLRWSPFSASSSSSSKPCSIKTKIKQNLKQRPFNWVTLTRWEISRLTVQSTNNSVFFLFACVLFISFFDSLIMQEGVSRRRVPSHRPAKDIRPAPGRSRTFLHLQCYLEAFDWRIIGIKKAPITPHHWSLTQIPSHLKMKCLLHLGRIWWLTRQLSPSAVLFDEDCEVVGLTRAKWRQIEKKFNESLKAVVHCLACRAFRVREKREERRWKKNTHSRTDTLLWRFEKRPWHEGDRVPIQVGARSWSRSRFNCEVSLVDIS